MVDDINETEDTDLADFNFDELNESDEVDADEELESADLADFNFDELNENDEVDADEELESADLSELENTDFSFDDFLDETESDLPAAGNSPFSTTIASDDKTVAEDLTTNDVLPVMEEDDRLAVDETKTDVEAENEDFTGQRREPFLEENAENEDVVDAGLSFDAAWPTDNVEPDTNEPFFEKNDEVLADDNPFFEAPVDASSVEDTPVFDNEEAITNQDVEASWEKESDVVETDAFDVDLSVGEEENLSEKVEVNTDITEDEELPEGFFAEENDLVEAEPLQMVDDNVESVESTDDAPDNFFGEDVIIDEPPLDGVIDEAGLSDEETAQARADYFVEESQAEETSTLWNTEEYSAVAAIEESQNVGYLQWYSGNAGCKMFEIGKGFESGRFDADEECKVMHVNAGYDTYGWEVQFSDGVVMNLRDVREYQIRNGRLPNSDGRIIYGHSSLMFAGVERIVVYESVRYFSYGI